MKIFGQIIRTVVNVVTLPVAITKDVLTLGGTMNGKYNRDGETYTGTALEQVKREASEDGR